MIIRHLILVVMMLTLTACGGSSRPSYYGKEESTAGVPGWSPDGKRKLAPTVKLGTPYRVNGVNYVPRYQPDYNETGMASWYGPGFHGGKTANGEQFSTHERTAAHTTLPLPSVVRVTNLRNNKSTIVRINDRGPFARGRIIDLSKAAAEDIDMLGEGIGRVRVQYLPAESEKFLQLIASGRDPQSIDLASEVLGHTSDLGRYAATAPIDDSIQITDTMPAPVAAKPSLIQQMNPVATAYAEPPPIIPAPAIAVDPTDPFQFAMADAAPAIVADAGMPPAELPPAQQAPVALSPAPVDPAMAPGIFLQLGTFSQLANAEALRYRASDLTPAYISTAHGANDAILYRVRMGPFVNQDAATEMLERMVQMGIGEPQLVTQQ
jgi:rare lipoprotein A